MAERELSELNRCRVEGSDVVCMTQRSVAVVEWRESGLKRKYRLGHKGKVGRRDV